jgi:hypothetical protein
MKEKAKRAGLILSLMLILIVSLTVRLLVWGKNDSFIFDEI